jgi:iron complex transport system substrate-binding protein
MKEKKMTRLQAASTVPKKLRIISLLPSATDLLAYLQKEDWLVGRSHECDFPSSIKSLPIVTAQRTVFTTSKDVDQQVFNAIHSKNSSGSGIDRNGIAETNPKPVKSSEVSTNSCSLSQIDPNASLYTLNLELIKSLKPDLILTQDICNVCSVNLSQVRSLIKSM